MAEGLAAPLAEGRVCCPDGPQAMNSVARHPQLAPSGLWEVGVAGALFPTPSLTHFPAESSRERWDSLKPLLAELGALRRWEEPACCRLARGRAVID